MKIINLDIWLDGGTIAIQTDEGDFYLDRRLGTDTFDEFYSHYPDNIDAVKLEINEEIKEKLIVALQDYPSGFYVNQVESLLNKLRDGENIKR